MNTISKKIQEMGVVPVVVLNDAKDAKPLAQALCEGGLPCAEVTFRTEVYHVLDGLINTQKGVLPDQLNIMTLLNRVNERTEEVILALDPTVEGETTALYISKLLEGKCRVSRLAHGIPVGSHLDYTDAMTLLKAFEGRKSS